MKINQQGRRADTVAAAQILWGKASKAERTQIQAFIKACTEPKRLVYDKKPHRWVTDEPCKGVPYYLRWIRHLDSGKEILTAGCAGPDAGEPGMTANQIRKVVGLPPVKGGDYKIVVKPQGRPSAGGKVSLGKRKLPSRSKGETQ